MTTDERTMWVKTLKEEDKVCFRVSSFGGSEIIVVHVASVTKTGKIRTSDGMLFNIQGRAAYGDSYVYLAPYTAEIEAEIDRKKLITKAKESVFTLSSSNRINLSAVANGLLKEIIDLEKRITESLKEHVPVKEEPKKLCSCGREATRIYGDVQTGAKSDVCYDCYDINGCQEQGYAETGDSYSDDEAIEILKMDGWKSHYE